MINASPPIQSVLRLYERQLRDEGGPPLSRDLIHPYGEDRVTLSPEGLALAASSAGEEEAEVLPEQDPGLYRRPRPFTADETDSRPLFAFEE
ncbi:MAG: hypothetical protein HYV08_13715 [Deltaproteobacteria bacterium]|nr:hypothetical protein [Deltaproteobacteria bacterium]MBI3076284.1 hypothetical protein [Deltaproteobacteria bacterium]